MLPYAGMYAVMMPKEATFCFLSKVAFGVHFNYLPKTTELLFFEIMNETESSVEFPYLGLHCCVLGFKVIPMESDGIGWYRLVSAGISRYRLVSAGINRQPTEYYCPVKIINH